MNASCEMRVYNVQRNRPGWVVSPGRAHVAEMATGHSPPGASPALLVFADSIEVPEIMCRHRVIAVGSQEHP